MRGGERREKKGKGDGGAVAQRPELVQCLRLGVHLTSQSSECLVVGFNSRSCARSAEPAQELFHRQALQLLPLQNHSTAEFAGAGYQPMVDRRLRPCIVSVTAPVRTPKMANPMPTVDNAKYGVGLGGMVIG